MSIQVKTKYIVLAVGVAILALFSLGWYFGSSRQRNALKSLTAQYSDSILTLKVKLHGAEMTAYQMSQLVVSQKEAIKDLGIKNSDLKKLGIKQANEITELKLKIDTLLHVDHSGQVVVVHDTITQAPHNAILLPFSFSKKDKWLELNGVFNSSGKLDCSLKMDATFDAISGRDMENKLKLTLLTDNPYLKTISIKSYKTDVVKPKKWAIGFQAGYGFVLPQSKKVELAPYLGAGITRTIIRF